MPQMMMNISEALGVGSELVSIKAKTNEGVGVIGAGKAVSTFCTVMLRKIK
ncbi:2-C-methyl-D-erythritol 2,4-cyclodiphosphate synthase [Thermodesulfobacteriota bacterium]